VSDWWSPLLGPGYALDTRVFFIIGLNCPGSPYGSISPVALNDDLKPYGVDFPEFTIRDSVRYLLGVKYFV
jgi:homoserine O-acetyltransferase/O-succinyltransferase